MQRGQESVDQILKGGQHLLTLINEVLDIARVEAGKLQLSLEPVDLHETINEALDLVRPLAPEAEITITVEHHDGDSHVTADRQRLSQVMLNLLSNAIKYNEPGGSVRVTTRRQNTGMARISVTDTGAGISAEGSLASSPPSNGSTPMRNRSKAQASASHCRKRSSKRWEAQSAPKATLETAPRSMSTYSQRQASWHA